ncbi:hypothetical protein NUW54_g13379 [Trametes sanguinea]|uniref:Uncharacterized protein n=1 Tax=Trametes sanguinea TaxID=158606 RepID=A0ACC1MLQ5_9APHY|nr:hypothetical protein NUW54_g13379 [Trametes sanguinea]
MAKKELQWSPLLGQFMTLAGAVFVDRGNNARAVRSLTAAGENGSELQRFKFTRHAPPQFAGDSEQCFTRPRGAPSESRIAGGRCVQAVDVNVWCAALVYAPRL